MEKKSYPVLPLLLLIGLLFVQPSFAGLIYQNFEPDNGAPINVSAVGTASVQIVGRTEAVHLGRNAVKSISPFYWTGVGVQSQVSTGDTDIKQVNNDRLTFWIYAMPDRKCYVYGCDAGTDNNVGVTFYDNNLYSTTGFEVWTTQTARYARWSKLKVLFSQLPPDFDLRHVTRIEFKNYWPGKYYIDDIHAVREDRVYQSFEKEERSGSTDSEYGWKWNPDDTVAISEPAFEGAHSWKLISTAKWGGTGIQSQEKKYFNDGTTVEQTFWHVDLNPEVNDRLTFWVNGLPENGMDNNLAVQFYDNGAHFTDDTKVVVWPNRAATYGRWTRMTVLFSELKKIAPDLDLSDINKIQFQHYWPGTYYIDDIRACGKQPIIKEAQLAQGIVEWEPIDGAQNYRLQENTSGPQGNWSTIYSGPLTNFNLSRRLSKSWLRVRWEEAFVDRNTLPYASGWSEPVEYLPPAIVFNYDNLNKGLLTWSAIPQTPIYEIQSAPSKFGPWTHFYKGVVPSSPLAADPATWYRLRAVMEDNGKVVDLSPWCRPQKFDPGKGFVRAAGTVLRDSDGAGDELVLNGVNFGGSLIIEPWMTGLGTADDPAIEDDWSIREQLISRFANADTEALLRIYQEAYLNSFDFDRLLDQGITLVRLPFFYRNLQDDDGNWILNSQGEIDFSPIDRVVNALADRGIYMIIDMHGAPGGQSAESHTGRKGFNKLFAPDGEAYRVRTEDMWREIARHYKDNVWVLGYDLLNEPLGAAPDKDVLANLYDRLYQAIRAVDANHLVIMEGIWYPDPTDPEPDPAKKRYIVDWDTLPNPADKGWTNVLYEFHFYNWGHDDDLASHQSYVDQKVSEASVKQPLYNVPVIIGEFFGFSFRSMWDYYIQNFNAQKWGWTTWSYKYHGSPSTWGIVNHANYDEGLPVFETDTYDDLSRKLSKYTTADYHVPSVSLQEMISESSLAQRSFPSDTPYISSVSALFVGPGNDFTITGVNFGASQGSSTASYAGVPLPIVSWSDTSIHVYLRSSEPAGSGLITVTTAQGTSNGVDIIVVRHEPGAGMSGSADGMFVFSGFNLGDTPGTFQFYPAPCDGDIIPPFYPCNNGDAAIAFWSDSLIKGYVPPDAADTSSRYNIKTQNGGELYPTMLPFNTPPVLDPIGPRSVNEGESLTFNVNASDPDPDNLVFSAVNLPSGATFIGQTFNWTPRYDQAGVYQVTFRVSDGSASDEEIVTITVNNAPLPDLIMTAVNGPLAGETGNSIIVTDTVKNLGHGVIGSFYIGIYLSSNSTITTSDRLIGWRYVSGLLGNETNSGATAVDIPRTLSLGRYYIGAIADYSRVAPELNENNNALRGNRITVTAGADLTMNSINGPLTAKRGTAITVNNTVTNQGTGDSESFYVGLYLSRDAIITTSDRRIARRYVSALPAGSSDTANSSATIPSAIARGTYYFGAIADYSRLASEKNESNNKATGNSVTIN